MPIKEPAMHSTHIRKKMEAIHESPLRACASVGCPEEMASWDRCHALRISNFPNGINKEL